MRGIKMRKLMTTAGAAALVALLAAPASAHVTVQPNEAPAGAFYAFVVRVPNERDDADTTKITVDLPDDLVTVSFQPKEGWDYKVTMKKLDEPVELFGAQIDEIVDTVTWSGGSIAPHEFDEFGFSTRVPEEPGALVFGATQTYSSGEVVEWTGEPESETPAAQVNVVALDAEEGQGPLAILADVQEELAGGSHAASMDHADDGEDDDGDLGVILGAIGSGLGALALALVLFKRPR
jgi:uncharacterized protein YcnI